MVPIRYDVPSGRVAGVLQTAPIRAADGAEPGGMRTTTATRRAARGAAAGLLLLLAGCAGAAPSPTSADAARAGEQERADTGGHAGAGHHESPHGDGHEDAQGHHGEGSEDGHHTGGHHSGAAEDNLLRASDLPEGYTTGGHHHVQPAVQLAAPPVPEECAPIAELLGEHPSVRQTAHPQVGVAFSKSHFGPQLSQTIIDVGGFAEAAAARKRVATAVEECDRYVQSTSSIGATTYRVTELPTPADAEEGVYFRLDAIGDDFTGISWDVWAHDCEGTLMAVAFRSAKNGDNEDFWAATHAAMDRMHPAMAG